MAGYSDVIVLRHYESGASNRAAACRRHPGDQRRRRGRQHPTQALLDLFTIQREIGRLQKITVCFGGRSSQWTDGAFAVLSAAKYEGVKMYFVAPEMVRMKGDIKEYLQRHQVPFEEVEDLHEVARQADVVYQTRIQKERFGERTGEYEQARGRYIVDRSVMDCMQEHAVVMHPLPRVDEIDPEVDADPRAAYFRQAHNGLYVRMALLRMILA